MPSRATKAWVEILRRVEPGDATARTTKAWVEVLRRLEAGDFEVRATKLFVEILAQPAPPPSPPARATKAWVEILRFPQDTTEPPPPIVRNVFRVEAPPLTFPGEPDEHRRKISQVVREMLIGRMNNTGTVTLTPNASSTTVTDIRVLAGMVILLVPQTASAAAEWATTYVDPRNGSFIVNHDNNAVTDRLFGYAIFG